jgi:hypothetical protein
MIMRRDEFLASALHRVILGSVTKQSSNGRIVVSMRMPLTGESLAKLPDWLVRGYEAVAKQFTEVDPDVQAMEDLAIAFTNERKSGELFATRAAKVASASLRSFKIVRAGKPDDPEVELHFKLYCAFARDFWAWAGEMSSEEVYMTFPAGQPAEAPAAETATLPLEDAGTELPATEPSMEEATGEREPGLQIVDARKGRAGKKPGKKSGPIDLARKHERQLDAGRLQ